MTEFVSAAIRTIVTLTHLKMKNIKLLGVNIAAATILRKKKTIQLKRKQLRVGLELVPAWSHKPNYVGSNPTPATQDLKINKEK